MAAFSIATNPDTAFNPRVDVLQLDCSASEVSIRQVGNDVVIRDVHGHTAVLRNVLIEQLTSISFGTANIVSNDGSVFLIGDATTGALFDADAQSWVGAEKNDQILGRAGNDTLDGGLGHDLIYGNWGSDIILSGLGRNASDQEQGEDTVYGGQGSDQIGNNAMTGNKTLYGNVGDDTIVGGTGNDTLFGNWGNDIISGGAGNNLLFGGRGNDMLSGGSGADTIHGQLDNDNIDGAGGNDQLYGGSGTDIITGGSGADLIYGQVGADRLDGGRGLQSGNDTIFGGEGNDTISGSGTSDDADIFIGGLGQDTFIIQAGDNGITSASAGRINDFVSGLDRLDYDDPGSATNYSEFSRPNVTSVEQAAAQSMNGAKFMFIAGGQDGYLLIDTDANGVADEIIVLQGQNNLDDFTFLDII
jgi:Ca2+-binding RTX toxin-like protein